MTDELKCDACGINPWQVETKPRIIEYRNLGIKEQRTGWRVCFLCIAEFVKETDATPEAFEWWIEKERGNEE